MKKLILAVLALATVAVGQETDTLVAQKQVTQAAYVQRPNFRRVTKALNVGDSVRVVLWVNGTPTMNFRYTVTRAPLDTANNTKLVLTGFIDDFSK